MPDTILIIDDERPIAQLTALWMKQAGYLAVTAFDGTSGLAAAARVRPQLILLDIRMPDIDGFEVFRRLAADADLAGIPVIFLSAHAQEAAKREAIDNGARGFLSKPYEFKALLAAVTGVLAAGRREHSEISQLR